LLLAELRQTRSERGGPRKLPGEQHASRGRSACACMDTQLDRLPTLYWGDSRQLERVGTTTRNIRLGGDAPDVCSVRSAWRETANRHREISRPDAQHLQHPVLGLQALYWREHGKGSDALLASNRMSRAPVVLRRKRTARHRSSSAQVATAGALTAMGGARIHKSTVAATFGRLF
jgi:hypothetical protein